MYLYLYKFFLLIICVLASVTFLTLMEWKDLGYIQIRKGTMKRGYVGNPQPFSDAMKLICKAQPMIIMSNYLLYYFSPILNLMFSLLVWIVYPYLTYMCSFSYIFYFLWCTSLDVNTVINCWLIFKYQLFLISFFTFCCSNCFMSS